ncbi:hypothetical protein GALL_516520 [mine drainage metagenome]|uniref:Uncharacterized protein n=1 Tax=mine drainage metagenome TaxID=410659 RepID=A0A1J5P5G6_9ZZZZ
MTQNAPTLATAMNTVPMAKMRLSPNRSASIPEITMNGNISADARITVFNAMPRLSPSECVM